MLIGFGKRDITPRIGAELVGYSGYLNRYGTAVRDRLNARSVAFSDGDTVAVAVSCDILYIPAALTAEVRQRVAATLGRDDVSVLVHATHTHSGPAVRVDYQNAYDPAWNELLPRRIAQSCVDAVRSMQEAELHHAAVPCEGMSTNRVYDRFRYGPAALEDGFRPEKPELTDTVCHVLKAVAGERMLGFVTYFGCHNVVGGPESTYIHGDWAGIATGMLERENPGAIGVFLQGAEGDVNSATCCLGNDQVLAALDIMASRYARSVRVGLAEAKPLEVDRVRAASHAVTFPMKYVPLEELRERLAAEDAVIDKPDATDADGEFRMAVLRATALRSILARAERGEPFEAPTEVQGFRVGPLAILATPFEVFQAIKNDVVAGSKAPIPLMLGMSNDDQGYATDRTAAADPSDYAAYVVPLWKHTMPYANIHDELVKAVLRMDATLA